LKQFTTKNSDENSASESLEGSRSMNTAARRSPAPPSSDQETASLHEENLRKAGSIGEAPDGSGENGTERRARVYIAAENRLLREALSRMLRKKGGIEVVTADDAGPGRVEGLLQQRAEILLLASRGHLADDICVIREVRLKAPQVRILLVGLTENEMEFLQYVRAGISGYLPQNASAEDVIAAMRAVKAGEAVCPGGLCATLFRYFESEATSVQSAGGPSRLGLTRREQQIVPLIAQGLTNKEIANRFCLSEQTVKNHLYRMKHKVGAVDRFGIVQHCRTHGFLA
jgi:DNA-binding NarL/FixJ family response regulator